MGWNNNEQYRTKKQDKSIATGLNKMIEIGFAKGKLSLIDMPKEIGDFCRIYIIEGNFQHLPQKVTEHPRLPYFPIVITPIAVPPRFYFFIFCSF